VNILIVENEIHIWLIRARITTTRWCDKLSKQCFIEVFRNTSIPDELKHR